MRTRKQSRQEKLEDEWNRKRMEDFYKSNGLQTPKEREKEFEKIRRLIKNSAKKKTAKKKTAKKKTAKKKTARG